MSDLELGFGMSDPELAFCNCMNDISINCDECRKYTSVRHSDDLVNKCHESIYDCAMRGKYIVRREYDRSYIKNEI